MTAWLLANAAEEHADDDVAALLGGLVFILVIAFGETSRWLRHRR